MIQPNTSFPVFIVPDLDADKDWGQYHFCIEDPNRIQLDIVQTIAATKEYQDGYNTK